MVTVYFFGFLRRAGFGVLSADGLTWLASDYQGTAQVAVTEVGQQVQVRRQLPFGDPRGAVPPWPNQLGFVGGDVDRTGLTHLGAREYDPVVGRFISIDPIMDLTDPQQTHGYTYANNNPVTFTDPDGLMPVCAPDAYSICPDYSVKNQAGFGNGGSDRTSSPLPPPPPPAEDDGGLSCHNPWECLAQIAGVNKGAGEQLLDTATGLWDMGADWVGCMRESWVPIACDPATLLALAVVDDPGGVWSELWHGLWDPIEADWREGNRGEAAGRGTFLLVEAVLGSKGAGGLLKALRAGRANACSFGAGTPVLMADGTTRLISELEQGDLVLAADPLTGEQSAQVVTAVWVHEDTLVDLRVLQVDRDGAGLAGWAGGFYLAKVSTTGDHPFWNGTDQQWQQAHALDFGDWLLSTGGSPATVVGLLWGTQRDTTAYNLTVTHHHTYYVLAGQTPVLVHNAGGETDRINFGNGFTGRVDQYVSRGGQTSFEIHVYQGGREYGVYGSNGWFSKHGLAVPANAPQQLENTLKGHAVDFMRRSGQLGSGDNIKGDNWMRPRIESGC